MTRIDYYDKKFGWVVYPILGFSFIFFANDNDFKTLIQLPSFKWDIAFSFLVVSIIGYYLGWLVRFLDKRKDLSWERNFSRRGTTQFLYGIVVPLLVAFGFELIYLRIINLDLGQSSILNLEMPLAFLYLLIINLLYYFNYISITSGKKPVEKASSSLLSEKVKVSLGTKERLLPIKDIAFLKSEEKMLWLYTFENTQYYLNGTLKDWEEKLPGEYFYRINRQVIVHKDAIEGLESTKTRRLKVILKKFEEDFNLPKSKVTDFRGWWKS